MTKILLDSANSQETQELLQARIELAGQTTNPTLALKNPLISQAIAQNKETGKKLKNSELMDLYKQAVTEIDQKLPGMSVSVQVYVDDQTSQDEVLSQAREMNNWGSNIYIKLPTNKLGISSAQKILDMGIKVNLTLVFSELQVVAIDLATQKHQAVDANGLSNVLVSPFVGRLDDIGQNGMDLIRNCNHYKNSHQSKLQLIAASIRNQRHFDECYECGVDIITAPKQLILDYRQNMNKDCSDQNEPQATALSSIPKVYNQTKNWQEIDIHHPLTEKGLARFIADWQAVMD